MKLPTPFTIYDLRFTIWKKSSVRGLAANRKSPIVNRKSTSGIALVITLILLSVTLVMAVAFLAIARRERNSVTTTTDTATARLAADSALAAAQAQIVANILTTTNPYNYSLLVSTNYSTPGGITPGAATLNYISYYDTFGNLLAGGNLVQSIANLYLLPRAPVFVYNRNTGSNDFRFYLDLNRNRVFEANGLVTNFDNFGNVILDANNNPVVSTNMVGDPEWVGVLEHPDQPHSPNNKFVARFAFLAQPIGNSLDLNYIHNEAMQAEVDPLANGNDSFLRNQGVGSWEINLAAFLADLNTNQWDNSSIQPYQYYEPGSLNRGYAFEDALSLLSYRYGYTYSSLTNLSALFVNSANLQNQTFDLFPLGPLLTNASTSIYANPTNAYWAGSDNTNRFFALPSELFDTTKIVPTNFIGHLQNAGAGVSTYDRYTFYRMLDQLGTDSTADDTRMNVNYSNAVVSYNASGIATNIVIISGAETNATPWRPLDFFTVAANALLLHYTANWTNSFNYYTNTFGASTTAPFGVTNIPVYINGQFVYTPAVNRLLQLAANMYDATTNKTALLGKDFPSVFRPMFTVVLNGTYRDVFITGYTNVFTVDPNDSNDHQLDVPTDIAALSATNIAVNNLPINVYGVPWIIGAKKGFPNFNNFALENVVSLTRRLQVTRDIRSLPFKITGTNQMYVFNISDGVGWDFWNSYNANYNGTIVGQVRMNLSVGVTNDENFTAPPQVYPINNAFTNVNWLKRGGVFLNTASFVTNVFAVPFFSSVVYRTPTAPATTIPAGFTPPCFVSTNAINPPLQDFETNNVGFPFPSFGELVTNQLQVFLLSTNINGAYQVIDYAHFKQDYTRDLNSEIFSDDSGLSSKNDGVWNTNIDGVTKLPYGIKNQLLISQGLSEININEDGSWKADPNAATLSNSGSTPVQQAYFKAFLMTTNGSVSVSDSYGQAIGSNSNNITGTQAPYSPTRYVVSYTVWQANDPLVHYLASDLTPSVNLSLSTKFNAASEIPPLVSAANIGGTTGNKNYQPWGGNTYKPYSPTPGEISFYTTTVTNLALKDPLVKTSDNWDFPTNKFPTVGWLGRVHRGTPWQTVYLKANDITTNGSYATWTNWTGNQNIFDATNSAPVQDRDLFDLFTSTPNVNATHGTLSVNQTHLAAWSALLSGLVVPNNLTGGYTNISPAGVDTVNSAVGLILNGTKGINAMRAAFTNTDGVVGAFEHVGNILRTPALAEQSPFLNPNTTYSDELYEWLPQQTLGLLRVSSTPRYVIYCYGQTLRPAPNGIVTDSSGGQFGLCTNYQVTAESAARVVLRVDNAKTGSPRVVIESFNALPPN